MSELTIPRYASLQWWCGCLKTLSADSEPQFTGLHAVWGALKMTDIHAFIWFIFLSVECIHVTLQSLQQQLLVFPRHGWLERTTNTNAAATSIMVDGNEA